MRRIYLISYDFAPTGRAPGVNRTFLAKFLAERGCEVDVFSCSNPHAFMRSFQPDHSLLRELPANVRVWPVRSRYWGPVGGLLSLAGVTEDPYGNWLRPAIREVVERARNPGWIYAVVPPKVNARVAFAVSRKLGLPMVLDFRDNVHGLPREIVRHCATIIASTEVSLRDMREEYRLASDRGITMYNGFQRLAAASREDGGRKEAAAHLRLVYAGLLNLDQDPVMVARALELLARREPEAAGRITVDYFGPRNYYVRWFLRRHLSETVRYRGFLEFNRMLEALPDYDLGLVTLRARIKTYCVPSKVFQYMAAGVPMLASGRDGALKEMVEESGTGLFVPFADLERLAEALHWLLGNPQERRRMRERLLQLRGQYAMPHQVDRMLAHLDDLAGGPIDAGS